ncbi:MAG: RNA polymerase sigma factor [Candidatus Pelethousia sp.]|nr:RNA polymerase sigma factor [Candidatus Pelethousia sp.]
MLDALIESQGPRLFGLCRKLCAGWTDAEDLYQETLLRALQKQDILVKLENPGGYLARVCVNLYRDGLRRKKLLSFLSLNEEGAVPPEAFAIPPPQVEEAAFVRQAVDGLPEPYRQAVLLYYFCDQSVERAARVLGVRPGTVKSRLSRGRELLREALKDE